MTDHPRQSHPRLRAGLIAAAAVASSLVLLTPTAASAVEAASDGTAARAPQLWWSFRQAPACPGSEVPVELRAKSQWYNAPPNGYVELLRQRQASDGQDVVVAASKKLTTKNTSYEGNRGRFVWNTFTPTTRILDYQQWTRGVFVLTFKKDDAARDTVVRKVTYATQWCIQGE